MKRLQLLLLVSLVMLLPRLTAAQVLTDRDKTEHVSARLFIHAPNGIRNGSTFWAGIALEHQPKWHTYWKNSGDSGLPTQLEWTLPKGLTAGPILWPTPEKIDIGHLTNFGYHGSVLLLIPMTLDQNFTSIVQEYSLPFKVKVSMLVCRLECIPETLTIALNAPLNSSISTHTKEFEDANLRLPQVNPAKANIRINDSHLEFHISDLPKNLKGKKLFIFPESPEIIDSAGQWDQAWVGDLWRGNLPISSQRSTNPPMLKFVLGWQDVNHMQGLAIEAPFEGIWTASTAVRAGEISPALQLALNQNVEISIAPLKPPSSLWIAILGALLGGLILNLMPCVFPILTIKFLSFSRPLPQGQSHMKLALAYSAGVVLSFLAFGFLILALRSAGGHLGWGFQLQSPWIVASLAGLFTVLALNLIGGFEFGHFVPQRWVSYEAQNPSINSFFSGVLAVVVASPCTAPFMGASLGLALSLPKTQALSVFIFLGVGMALPMLLASAFPALSKKMPQPGAWMVTLRQGLAFPLFATVIWLVWVLGQQSGINAVATLLTLLLILSALIVTNKLSKFSQFLWRALLLSIFLIVIVMWGPQITASQEPQKKSISSNARWQAWSPSEVRTLLGQGKTVFVDFTAAWCVTCQYNKQTTLSNPIIHKAWSTHNVSTLRADWTNPNTDIAQALRELGRNGIPVYAVYRPGKPVKVLSEILTVQEVLDAISLK